MQRASTNLPLAAIGLALLTFLVIMCPTRYASAQCAAPALMGNWVNVQKTYDSATRTGGLPKIVIDFVGGCDDTNSGSSKTSARVHVWGMCEPKWCDWGTASTPVTNPNSFRIRFNQGFAIVDMTLRAQSGQLKVDTRTKFTDPNRQPVADTHDVFEKVR